MAALYNAGYVDERFQHPVGQTLHCIICTNVLKDPVMCGHNEHLFCRACITTHLRNVQECPTCRSPLTVDTLKQASRSIRNLLSELKIRCEFFDRGCATSVELANLERHVADCGFAPAICSNEGCGLEVNQQDLLHHETATCEQRRVKCHSCGEIKHEIETVEVTLVAMNETLENSEMATANVCAQVVQVREQLSRQEEDNFEIKNNIYTITEQFQRMIQKLDKVQAEQEEMKKAIAQANSPESEPMLVIIGGWNRRGDLVSVEMFSMSNGTWTPLKPTTVNRAIASSVVYNNQIIVSGGFCSSNGCRFMERLSRKAIQEDQSIPWESFPAQLPATLYAHCTVVYNGRLIVIGGFGDGQGAYSNRISEISLVPPYNAKHLATLPQPRYRHGVALFDDKIVIFGGRAERYPPATNHKTVLLYDITKNECRELAPLPDPVSEMATVKWGDDNVIIVGGVDINNQPLSTAFTYNVKTQKSFTLPEMKHKRRGCTAAVIKDTVIVVGGQDEKTEYLKSVENFKFERFAWEELAEMHEERKDATAVVC
jgi:hypothetical protein